MAKNEYCLMYDSSKLFNERSCALHRKYNLNMENALVKHNRNSESRIVSSISYMNIYNGVFCPHNLMQRIELYISLCRIVQHYATGQVYIILLTSRPSSRAYCSLGILLDHTLLTQWEKVDTLPPDAPILLA